MFKLIIETAVRHRWLVVFLAALIAAVARCRSTRWHRR